MRSSSRNSSSEPRRRRGSRQTADARQIGLQQPSGQHAEGDAVLAAGEVGELRGEDREERRDRERDHGEEDRLHAQREQADRRTTARAQHQRRPRRRARARPRSAPSCAHGDADAVAADAEEHGVREGDDAGVAEQQVVARDQHDEDADLGRDVRATACRGTGTAPAPGRRGWRPAATASTRLRGRSPERRQCSDHRLAHRIEARAAATAGSAPSAGCSSRARASARGSRRSWPSGRPAARRRSSRRPSPARR